MRSETRNIWRSVLEHFLWEIPGAWVVPLGHVTCLHPMCTQGAGWLPAAGFLVGASWAPRPAQLHLTASGLAVRMLLAFPSWLALFYLLSSWEIRFSPAWYFAKSTYFACLKKLESIFCYPLIRLQIHFYFQFFLSHRFCRGSPFFFFSCTERKNLQSCLLWIQDCGWDAFLLFRTTVSAGQSSWKLSN